MLSARQTITACLILILGAATVAGCSSARVSSTRLSPTTSPPSTSKSSPTASPTPSSPSFPAFQDWRAAYYAPDGHLHAVTLDGKTDLTGPVFPGFSPDEGNGNEQLYTAGASPDGHFIAYLNPYLTVFDVRAQTLPAARLHQGGFYISNLFWSPNSQLLAIGDSERNNVPGLPTYIVSPSPLTIPDTAPIPGTSIPDHDIIPQGWLDDHTLLAFTPVAESNNTSVDLIQSLDITTGAVHTIATFPHAELSNPNFTLSPDGKEVLIYNSPAHAEPFTPMAEVLDVQTGSMRSLPHLASLEAQHGTWISAAAWKPGTHTLAVTIGYVAPDENNAADWLVNTDQDTETSFLSGDYVQSWSPDGTTLVLSNAYVNENGSQQGPYTLTAVTFSASGQATLTTLTKHSLDFTFLGFIRGA